METVIDYDQLAGAYSKNLNTMLRGFNSTHDFLDLWVHDEDDTMSLVNMIESAEAFEVKKFQINFSENTLQKIDVSKLKELVQNIGSVDVINKDKNVQLQVVLK